MEIAFQSETLTAAVQAIRESFDAAREDQLQFADSLETVLDRLQTAHVRIGRWQDEAALEHQQACSEMARQQEQHQGEQQATVERYRREVETLRGECERLTSDLADRDEHLAELTNRVENAPEATADIQQKLEQARQHAARAMQTAQQHLEELQSVREENQALQSEIDVVRRRAIEATEQLEEQRQASVEDRVEWAMELKNIRQLIEDQGAASMVATAVTAPAQQDVANAAVADPMVGSVLAQFDKIRQQRAAARGAASRN